MVVFPAASNPTAMAEDNTIITDPFVCQDSRPKQSDEWKEFFLPSKHSLTHQNAHSRLAKKARPQTRYSKPHFEAQSQRRQMGKRTALLQGVGGTTQGQTCQYSAKFDDVTDKKFIDTVSGVCGDCAESANNGCSRLHVTTALPRWRRQHACVGFHVTTTLRRATAADDIARSQIGHSDHSQADLIAEKFFLSCCCLVAGCEVKIWKVAVTTLYF